MTRIPDADIGPVGTAAARTCSACALSMHYCTSSGEWGKSSGFRSNSASTSSIGTLAAALPEPGLASSSFSETVSLGKCPSDALLIRFRGEYFFVIFDEMEPRVFLAELELMVLLAVMRVDEDAYAVPISKELRSIACREVALASIYAALERLERKEFVRSTLGDPTPERGGRAKRYFHVTARGLRALKTTRRALTRLWSGIPLLEGRP